LTFPAAFSSPHQGVNVFRPNCAAERRNRDVQIEAIPDSTGSAPVPEVREPSQHPLTRTSGTKGHCKSTILVPLFDLKFLIELAAPGAGISNRRH
jgi:hypothetical protein